MNADEGKGMGRRANRVVVVDGGGGGGGWWWWWWMVVVLVVVVVGQCVWGFEHSTYLQLLHCVAQHVSNL